MDLSVFTGGNLEDDGDVEVGRARSVFRYNVLHLQDTFNALERARMPVLVATQGGVVGAGAEDEVEAAGASNLGAGESLAPWSSATCDSCGTTARASLIFANS